MPLLDRAWLSLLVRVPGALALAAMLVHAGMTVAVRDAFGASSAALVALFSLLSVAASWALSRLQAKRPALVAAIVLLGALPVALLLYHRNDAAVAPGYVGVLAYGAACGGLVLVFGGLSLVREPAKGAPRV